MSKVVGEVFGSMREVDGSGVVRTESRFDTTPDDLWEALTAPDRLARWLGEFGGDLRLGGTFSASFTSTWTGPGRIEVCEPPRRLRVRMGEPGEQTEIEAVITAEDDGALLVIEDRGLPLPELPAHGAGWQVHVEDLQRHLAGLDQVPWRDRWQELIPSYRERTVR